MPAVSVPSDSLYKIGGLTISSLDGCRDMTSSTSGRVIVAPTAFTVKKNSLFQLEIEAMHPGWYYTGLQYSTESSDLYVKVQQSLSDTGVSGSVNVPNPKTESKKDSLIGDLMPMTADLMAMDNIPIHYYGQPIDSKTPSDSTKNNTFLTKVIDENYVKVTMQSPYEFEIEVVASPTEDQWFYIPVANPKGLSSTVWGKVGSESTLPAGAAAGLIKVYAEALLDSSLGGYTLVGDELDAVKHGTHRVIDTQVDTETVGEWWSDSSSSDSKLSNWQSLYSFEEGTQTPEFIKKAYTDTFLNVPVIKTLNGIIQDDRAWYKLGYRNRACTVGTGLFVHNLSSSNGTARTAIYPYGNTFMGLSKQRNYSPTLADDGNYSVRMGDMLDCGDFLESVAKMGITTQDVDAGTVLPLCASDLQYKSRKSGASSSYNTPNSVIYRYGQPSFEGGVSVLTTPVYIPRDEGYHCYVPKMSFAESTRFHMLTATNVDEEVFIGLKYPKDLLDTALIRRPAPDVPTASDSWEGFYYVYRYGYSDHSKDAHQDHINKFWATHNPTAYPTPGYPANYPDTRPAFSIDVNPDLVYVTADDPTQGLFFNQAGFTADVSARYYSAYVYTRRTNYIPTPPVPSDVKTASDGEYVYYHCNHVDYQLRYQWFSSSDTPCVGRASSASLHTLGAGVAGMVMVFAGYIPAGSTPGTYKFKPFSSTESISGVLSCNPVPQFVSVSAQGSLSYNSTDAPYVGLNYVYVEGPNLSWNYDSQQDDRQDYEFYRVMLGVEVDKLKKTTMMENVIVAIDAEQVPLIGYPIAERPVLIQIDDASGVHLNDIEDLAITNPFYDDQIGEWVVVGASASHGKMYRIHVGMDSTLHHVVEFKTVRDSADLFETPYGKFTKLLGLCQTKDIHYLDERAEETKRAMAADVLFLVDDSGSMPGSMNELKQKINDMFTALYTTGVEDVRVGIACYTTKCGSVYYTGGGSNQLWATTQDQAQVMANDLKVAFVPGSHSKSAYHFSAIDWALQSYTFRDVKSRYIILITDTGDEGDPKSLADVEDRLVSRNIRVNVVSNAGQEAFYTPLVSATDGTFIPMSTVDGKTWGQIMAENLGSKMVNEIKTTYTVSVADSHLVLYGITEDTASSIVKGSNLVVATCRTYMEWDANKDTIVRIPVVGADAFVTQIQHLKNVIDKFEAPISSNRLVEWKGSVYRYYHQVTTKSVKSLKFFTQADDGSTMTCTVTINPDGSFQIDGDVEGGSSYSPDTKDGLLTVVWSKPTMGSEVTSISFSYETRVTEVYEDTSEPRSTPIVTQGTGSWGVTKLANLRGVPNVDQLYWSTPEEVPSDYAIHERVLWPHGVAVLFPYIYVLGYTYTQHPVNPDSYDGVSADMIITDKGWQMCMWKIDITAGLVSDPILIKDSSCFRFGFGIPARDKDARDALRDERMSIGTYPALYTSKHLSLGTMTRTFSNGGATVSFTPGEDETFERKLAGLLSPAGNETVDTAKGTLTRYTSAFKLIVSNVQSRARKILLAGSPTLPSKAIKYQFPSLSGLCGVAGQLLVFSNYHERPMLLNPLTGVLETTGLSIFPFTYPFDSNVTVSGETLSTMSEFNKYKIYTTHPFYQLCIGDGTSPNVYGMGIDVHDITSGETLVRRCYVRNNNLRDKLIDVTLSVPSNLVLPGSDMLYLSLTGNATDMTKVLTLDTVLHPCEKAKFYLHVVPSGSYSEENLIMYLNAKFSRVTEYFGYLS